MKHLFILLLLVGMAVVGWFTFRQPPQLSPIDSVDHVPQESGITTELPRVKEPGKPLLAPSLSTNSGFTLKERLSKVVFKKTNYPEMEVAEILQKRAFDADIAGLVTLRKAQPRFLIKDSAVNREILIEAINIKNRSLTPLLTPLPGKSVESSGQFGEVSGMDRIHEFAVDRATVRQSVAGSERRCDAPVSKKWKS